MHRTIALLNFFIHIALRMSHVMKFVNYRNGNKYIFMLVDHLIDYSFVICNYNNYSNSQSVFNCGPFSFLVKIFVCLYFVCLMPSIMSKKYANNLITFLK